MKKVKKDYVVLIAALAVELIIMGLSWHFIERHYHCAQGMICPLIGRPLIWTSYINPVSFLLFHFTLFLLLMRTIFDLIYFIWGRARRKPH